MPPRPRRAAVLRALLATSGLALAACAGADARPADGGDRAGPGAGTAARGDSVAIGVALNPQRPGMTSILQGVELAVAQLNAQRGDRPPFTMRHPPQAMTSAVQVAALLRDDPQVVGVVGHPESGTTQEALPLYEDVGNGGRRAVALVTPTATSPALSGRSPWLFRICPTDEAASLAVARFVLDSLHARHAAIIYRNDSYGRDWTRTFVAAYRAGGGAVVQRDPYLSGATEWAAYAAYMAQAGAEVLLFPGSVEDAEEAIRAVRATGHTIPFIGGDAASGLEEHAGEFAGARYTAFFDARQARTPQARAFVAAFEQRFGHTPDQRAALAYDAAMLIGRAALDVGADRRRVRDALAAIDATRPVEGAAGRIAFDENHDAIGKTVVVATVGAR
ncbi:MAG TPA: ABC transporter substrate-binding protein [Gemmatimonadaceae bacterium]|nr:ABC transporter substrate-binding protein [Gemmatimonadaceae bacterium]